MTWLQPIHEAFLEKYEPDINLKVNVAFQDYHEREDAKQEMRVELIKSYKSRDKHADWHNIVRGIINRRIIDYRKRLYRTPLVNMPNHRDNGDDFMAHIIENKIAEGQEVDSDFTDSVETADFLDNVLSVYANAEDEFDEWEQEYVEVLYGCYMDHSEQPIELEATRMKLMGYGKEQRKEFRARVKQFVKKLNDVIQRSRL